MSKRNIGLKRRGGSPEPPSPEVRALRTQVAELEKEAKEYDIQIGLFFIEKEENKMLWAQLKKAEAQLRTARGEIEGWEATVLDLSRALARADRARANAEPTEEGA